MFRNQTAETGKAYRLAMVGLLVLSATALVVTVWIMIDFLREQEIVQGLIKQLPADATASAEVLAGELRWQFRLTILIVLNLVVTGVTIVLLSRAYRSSQQSLRDIKARASDILSSMDLAIITTDLLGTVTSINRRGIELLGLTDEQVGQPLSDISKNVPLEDFRQEATSGGSEPLMRDFSVHAQSNTRTLRTFCQPLRNHRNESIGNILQFRDVTERVLVDDRMRRMERYLGLGSLAAGLHHEIKNPLAALSLHVQLLEEQLDLPKASDDVQEMLDVIQTEMTRVGVVLENFRDFASLGQLNYSSVDLPRLIDRQYKLIRPQASLRNIKLIMKVSERSLPPFIADATRLEQVLLNLLVNAMEAMHDGGILTVTASKIELSKGKCIQIEVADTGGGIPENLRDRIFDPYFTTKSAGTGMGLALCDKIIRQHNGTLDFHNTADGTVFEIIIPID